MERLQTCTFYERIGACRHGENCSRKHIKPRYLRTVMICNLYRKDDPNCLEFDKFFEDIFVECSLCGFQIVDMVVCENTNDHLCGNVYISLATDAMAEKLAEKMNNRWYNGRPVFCELSPVKNFSMAECKQHQESVCDRGSMCNFMHVKRPDENLWDELTKGQEKCLRELGTWVDR